MSSTEDQPRACFKRMVLSSCQTTSHRAKWKVMKAELPPVFADETAGRVMEKEGGNVRSVYGSHISNKTYQRLSRHLRIVEPAMRILGSEVYIYQFKINAKAVLIPNTSQN